MVIFKILKRNGCLTSVTVCRVFNLQDLLSSGYRKYSMILKNRPTLSLWNWTLRGQNSTLKKVIPETFITRILMPLISATEDKKETKPNQLLDFGMRCQSREQVWCWNTRKIKNGSIYSLKVMLQNQCGNSSKKN